VKPPCFRFQKHSVVLTDSLGTHRYSEHHSSPRVLLSRGKHTDCPAAGRFPRRGSRCPPRPRRAGVALPSRDYRVPRRTWQRAHELPHGSRVPVRVALEAYAPPPCVYPCVRCRDSVSSAQGYTSRYKKVPMATLRKHRSTNALNEHYLQTACPMQYAMEQLGGRWKLMLLWYVHMG
jgi:hypothetical protein